MPYDDDQEEETILIPPEYRELHAEEQKLSVRELWQRYMRGRLNLQAEFQRDYVWDNKRASRFIESLILNLPVPPIFVAENEDGSWEVVDGHQRLESLFGFLQPLAAGPSQDVPVPPKFRALKLRSLEVLHDDLNGRSADSLAIRDRESLLNRGITIVSIPRAAHQDLRFVLFARLNLGSVPLNPQELRNCIYRGDYNRLIRDLAEDPRTLALFGREEPHKRMRDRELVLRFFALSHRRGQYRTPYSGFLNDEMESNQNCDAETCAKFRAEFVTAVTWTRKIFGQEAGVLFRRGADGNARGRWDKWSDLIYEAEMVGFAEYHQQLEDVCSRSGDDTEDFLRCLRHKLVEVMSGERFMETLKEGTRRPQNVDLRFNLWTGMLASALEDPEFVRADLRSIRGKLQQSAFCDQCATTIDLLDDAVKIPEPGPVRLAHRSCYSRWASGLRPSTLVPQPRSTVLDAGPSLT